MTITAEGVETADQVRLVRALGCTEVQGYYFGRPTTAEKFLDLIHEEEAAA